MKIAPITLVALFTFAQTSFAENVERIASAGGAVTEILFELGMGDNVVAVDSTSIYPDPFGDLPCLGFVR